MNHMPVPAFDDAPPLPSCAFWNMRYLSYSVETAWDAKLRNVNALSSRHAVVGLSETHVDDELAASTRFFDHIRDARKFFGKGLAFVVQEAYATAHSINHENISDIVEGVAMAMRWEDGPLKLCVINFRLDAQSDESRIAQLHSITSWIRSHTLPDEVIIFGGDRNFTTTTTERDSSRRTPWRPSFRMNYA